MHAGLSYCTFLCSVIPQGIMGPHCNVMDLYVISKDLSLNQKLRSMLFVLVFLMPCLYLWSYVMFLFCL